MIFRLLIFLALCGSVLAQVTYTNVTVGDQFVSGTIVTCVLTPLPAQTGYETNLFAYYKCEQTDGSAVDSVNGYNFALDSGTPLSFTGIIGNAFEMLDWDAIRANDTDMDFSSHDFAIRFWFKPHDNGDGQIMTRGTYWMIRSVSVNTIQWSLETVASAFFTVTTSAMTLDAWHRIFVYHKTGVEIGIQLDDGSPVTLPVADAMHAGPTMDMYIEAIFDGTWFGIDEIAIWKDYIPTASDLTLDWNLGAGQTYPLP